MRSAFDYGLPRCGGRKASVGTRAREGVSRPLAEDGFNPSKGVNVTDKLQSAITRGHRAQHILADELFSEASDHIDAECFRLFKATHPTDAEALAQIAGIQYLHTKYKAFLKAAVQDGQMAQLEVERRKKTLKERVFG